MPQLVHPGAPPTFVPMAAYQGSYGQEINAPGAPHPSPYVSEIMQQHLDILDNDTAQLGRQDHVIDGQTEVMHVPLAKCRVLYIGSAVPLETANGLEAVQAPLRERYNSDKGDVPGIDAWVTIFSSGLQMQFLEEKSNVTWFPIQTLHVCAAVKYVKFFDPAGKDTSRFVALDSTEGQKCSHPPLFACIMRRTKGRKVLECHAFVCKSNEAAMAMVQACTHAYEHKEGWTDQIPASPDPSDPADTVRLFAADPKTEKAKEAPPEFYERPPAHGYFYTTSGDIVKKYNVYGEGPGGMPREMPRVHGPPVPYLPGPPGPYPPPPPPPHLVPLPPPHPSPLLPPNLHPGPPPMNDPRGPYMPHHPDYFSDWGMYSSPVVVFPSNPDDMYYRRSRRHRSPERRQHKRHSHRSPPRIVKDPEYRSRRRDPRYDDHEFEDSDRFRSQRDYYGGHPKEDPYRHDIPPAVDEEVRRIGEKDVWYDGRAYNSPVYKGLGYYP